MQQQRQRVAPGAAASPGSAASTPQRQRARAPVESPATPTNQARTRVEPPQSRGHDHHPNAPGQSHDHPNAPGRDRDQRPQRAPEQRTNRSGWTAVRERGQELDPGLEYERLRAALRIGDDIGDYAAVLIVADEAAINMVAAVELWTNALQMRERVEKEVEDELADLQRTVRTKFKDELGSRPAQDRVDVFLRREYPDAYRAADGRREEARLVARRCEGLKDAWTRRCPRLDAVVSLATR